MIELLLIVWCVFAAALLWLVYRAPTLVLLLVLASFAIGLTWLLEEFLPSRLLTLVTPAHKGLLVIALIGYALRYGVRTEIPNWPVLAVAVLLLQTVLLADLEPRLSSAESVIAAFALALPWIFVHMVIAPGTRAHFALVIMLLPALCVAAGVIAQALDILPVFNGRKLRGANNSGWFACLAFVGSAVAFHEAVRTAKTGFAYLAALNVSFAIASGGRMGIFACLVQAVVYGLTSAEVRARLRRFAIPLVIGGSFVAVVLVSYLPFLSRRMVGRDGTDLDLSGRGEIWASYLQDFLHAPWFGRGLGATALGSYYELPHNEYLRLLVEGGVAGFVLFAGAILLWGRQVLKHAAPGERPFVAALFLTLAIYATTDNVLLMPPALIAFAYLGVILSEFRAPSAVDAARGSRPRAPPLGL